MKLQSIDYIECERLKVQARLDREKTQLQRNKLGQFPTPTSLSSDILEYSRTLLPPGLQVRFLDPAFGTGSFYSALLRSYPSTKIASANGYEIDPHYGEEAVRLWKGTPLDLKIADFTQTTPPESASSKATLLICNPPYVRHHHLGKAAKLELQRATVRSTGIRLSGLAGLYCYFILISHAWMADGGVAGWLIPSEFMDVNYGKAIKHYLLNRVTLLRVHRFNPNEVQFNGALVSSAVVWFKNTPPPNDYVVKFTYGGTLASPEVSGLVPSGVLKGAAKWSKFPQVAPEDTPRVEATKLNDLFVIRRGLATGANDFFILTPEQVAEHRLPETFLIPILPSPRFLSVDEIEADDRGHPMVDRQLFLLNCDLPEKQVKDLYPFLWRYLQAGAEKGISARYLCRHRNPWYSQEKRPPPPFLCTYMNRRGAKSDRVFRFILNHSQATAANVYLLMYPKPKLEKMLKSKPDLSRVVWRALNEITPEALSGEGRVYGGGLHKLEPKELANASAAPIISAVSGVPTE